MAGDKDKICRLYASGQKCTFRNCKFSHSGPQNRGQKPSTGPKSGHFSQKFQQGHGSSRPAKLELSESEMGFRAWNLSLKADDALLTVYGLSKLFQQGQKLINTEAGTRQDVIRELATEEGLQRIRQAVDQDYRSGSLSKPDAFRQQIIPFFDILTHSEVSRSALLEQHVSQIYGYLYGVEGQRLIKLFTWILDVLMGSSSTTTFDEDLTTVLQMFSKMVDMRMDAQVNKGLHPLVRTLEDLIKSRSESLGSKGEQPDLYEATNLLARTQKRLKLGSNLPETTSAHRPATTKAAFVSVRQPPGGRHSNDFEDISTIAIMPTYDEIICPEAEYLPHKNPEENVLQGLEGLIDRQFRLLKEDAVGPLRDAIAVELGSFKKGARSSKGNQQGARTYSYKNLMIHKIVPDDRSGYKIEVSFDQPAQGKGLAENEGKRKDWWLKSKRLDPGALVCLVQPGTVLFCTMDQNSKPREFHKPRKQGENQDSAKQFRGLYQHPQRAANYLVIEEPSALNVRALLTMCKAQSPPVSCSMVEFPGILVPAFKPTLSALQQMKNNGDLPLSQLLVPSAVDEEQQALVPPPSYTQKRGFRFNLKCLTNDQQDLFFTPGQPFDVKLLQKASSLDEAQARALVDSLSRSLGLMQGPPGTGKSYVGVALIRVLLANREAMRGAAKAGSKVANDIGPIIIVTYTNHALDQLGEHLHHAGVRQIVRIGSQSKSMVLKDCLLRDISRTQLRTKPEKRLLWELHIERENTVLPQFQKLDVVNAVNSASALRDFIQLRWPEHHHQLFGRIRDEDGFEERKKSRAPKQVFRDWVAQGPRSPQRPRNTEALFGAQLSSMSKQERHKLFREWEIQYHRTIEQKLNRAIASHKSVQRQFDIVTMERDLRCLCSANIILLTTSGLARNLAMLRQLPSRILVCEEAGEVLEAHLLTTFLPSIEHAILIGDHQQLRPQIQNYDLAAANSRGKQYSFDESMFERLVQPPEGIQSVPYSTLETQRRMTPSVSSLIRETLYPRLKDGENVKTYEEITGLRKRLFWLDHTQPEAARQSQADQVSHRNLYEVDMAVALVRHVVSQGVYKPEDIAVITPYLGQLQCLKQALGSAYAIVVDERDVESLEKAGIEDGPPVDHEPDSNDDDEPAVKKQQISQTALIHALRLATIDNFQGEEAKLIILSLVRSNPQNNCGFLRTSNRINVALSRAKHGMVIIGNSQTASASVEMWAQVTDMLKADGNLGPSMELQCPRHPDAAISVTTPDDFSKYSPDGGCGRKCLDRLTCGHKCPNMCHSEHLHNAVECLEQCSRSLKGCDHSCPKPCGQSCPTRCQIDVPDPDRTLPCGHTAMHLPCWQSQDLKSVKCMVRVDRTMPGCGHSVVEYCHIDVNSQGYRCRSKCEIRLPCGHACKQFCQSCTTRSIDPKDKSKVKFVRGHGICQHRCGRSFTNCNHSCQQLCHGEKPCSPCNERCGNRCSHSQCPNICSDPCRPCAIEDCDSGCVHSRCTMPCAVPCNHVPCSKRCPEVLSCGHQCPSICGEVCPPVKFCQTCTQDSDVKATMVDFLEMGNYEDIDLDLTPCIFPECGHFLTAQSMDGQMSMAEYYEMDDNSNIVGVKKTLSIPFSLDEIKRCATCRGSLRMINRYGRLIRRAMLDEATKRFIVWSSANYVSLARELQKEQDALTSPSSAPRALATLTPASSLVIGGLKLEGSKEQQMKLIQKRFPKRHAALIALRQKLVSHYISVDGEEHPFKRVRALVQNPRRRREGKADCAELDDSLLQTRGSILAAVLLARCELVIISDAVAQCQKIPNRTINQDQFACNFVNNRIMCEELVTTAKATSNPLQEIEGHMFFAQYTALERQIRCLGSEKEIKLLETAKNHLAEAKKLVKLHSNETRAVQSELASIEKMLNGGTFYAPVTNDEMRAVVTAMATEFSGTGHWYHCENGHPFTIGECGMPMQEARCPQCGSPIGGQNHRAVEGVTHARELEQQFGRLAV